jgi:hypothetical protein
MDEKKLIQVELARQLERFGAKPGNTLLKKYLESRDLRWEETAQTVTCEGHFIRQPISVHLQDLRITEPEHFQSEPVGTNIAPVPPLKTILSTDQAAINKNIDAISRGEVVDYIGRRILQTISRCRLQLCASEFARHVAHPSRLRGLALRRAEAGHIAARAVIDITDFHCPSALFGHRKGALQLAEVAHNNRSEWPFEHVR